jgi:tetratricopeptide (TPR) repeat protein
MAGRRSPHAFDDLGEQQLKGFPDPVAICSVGWEPLAAVAGIPLPERLQIPARSLFGFFGRQGELDRLVESVKRTADGAKPVAFLSGEPGIGKTSLSRQVAAAAYDLGVPVLYGRCDEDLTLSYQPFTEALAHLVVHADESVLTEHVNQHGGALLSLVPQLSKRIPEVQATQSADPDAEQSRLFSAVVGLLASAASERGMLVVVDDLHWADKASLQLLRHLSSSAQLPKFMVLGTYRDSELSTTHPLTDTLATLRRQADVERIDLVGLEDFEIIGMMEQVAGHEMDKDGVDLAHAVRRETEGNPFFTTEMLRHLGESGLVQQDETGRWVASEDLYEKGLPQSVREVVGQRVDRLGEETRKVLSYAAIIGRDFDIAVLAAVSDTDEDSVLDLVDEAVAAGILTEVEGIVERFSFSHALTQHTLYEDLGATRRARVHRKIADVLMDLYGEEPESHAAELAHHFVAATKAADVVNALRFSKMAGEQALEQLAPADAVGWYRQALELYPQVPADEALHCDLLLGLGIAQRRSGDPVHRETLVEAAGIAWTLGDRDRLVAAALANHRGAAVATGEVDQEKVNVLERALEAVGPGDSSERARLLALLAMEVAYGAAQIRRPALVDEALATARRVDDPLCLLQVAGLVWTSDLTPQTVERRLADLEQAVVVAAEFGDLKAGWQANWSRGAACLQRADRVGFERHLDAVEVLADRLGEPFEMWSAKACRSMHSLLVGDVDRAERETQSALAAGESEPESMSTYAAQLIDIHRHQGRWAELEGISELMAAAAEQDPGMAILRAALARAYCDLGHGDAATEVISGDIANAFAEFPVDTTFMPSMTSLSEICVFLDRPDGATHIYDALSPWHAQISHAYVVAQGPAAFHLGSLATVLGRFDDAEHHLAEAFDISQRLGFPYWAARTQIAWAELVRKRNGSVTERAAELLDGARSIVQQFGFGALTGPIESFE